MTCTVYRLGDGPGSKHGDGVNWFASRGPVNSVVDLGTLKTKTAQQVTIQRAGDNQIVPYTIGDTPPCVTLNGLPSTLAQLPLGKKAFASVEDGVFAILRVGSPITLRADSNALNDDLYMGDWHVVYEDLTEHDFHTDRGVILAVDPLTILRMDNKPIEFNVIADTYIVNGVNTNPSALQAGMDCAMISQDGVPHKVVAVG